MFDENSSDQKNSNQVIDDKIRLVSKRSVSDDSISQHENSGWWNRAKRSFLDLFGWSSPPKEEPKALPKVDESVQEVKMPKPEALTASRNQQPESDQEDDDEDDGENSGENEIPREEDDEPEQPIPTPTTQPPFVKDDKYFRLKIMVNEFWSDKFLDKSSEEFQEFASSLRKGLENLYNEKSGREIKARVLEIR
jgi:hypothetical protein